MTRQVCRDCHTGYDDKSLADLRHHRVATGHDPRPRSTPADPDLAPDDE